MKAVFHTGGQSALGCMPEASPWCLAPFGGKPLVEYWLEWAALLGVTEVRLVLGDGAFEVESYCGDGSRWGLKITYGFLKNGADPELYLRRTPSTWDGGLLYICGPVFPRRLAADQRPSINMTKEEPTRLILNENKVVCLLSNSTQDILAFLEGTIPVTNESWSDLGFDPILVRDVNAYYELNMRLVKGENSRYVPQGYEERDGTSIGYNVQIPPSVELRPPFIIGNDCRFHAIAVIGPNAVIGNRVIVDSQTELSDSVVLDGTYLGRNLKIQRKIVTGTKIISPDSGAVVEITDPWLLARLDKPSRFWDSTRLLVGWSLSVILTLVQVIPFALLYPLVLLSGNGRFESSLRLDRRMHVLRIPRWVSSKPSSWKVRLFVGLSLDIFPKLALAACGRLWLCGHTPLHPERDQALRKRLHRYFPAAIVYPAHHGTDCDPAAEMANALYYERYASLREDLRTVLSTLAGRLLDALSGESDSTGFCQ